MKPKKLISVIRIAFRAQGQGRNHQPWYSLLTLVMICVRLELIKTDLVEMLTKLKIVTL